MEHTQEKKTVLNVPVPVYPFVFLRSQYINPLAAKLIANGAWDVDIEIQWDWHGD